MKSLTGGREVITTARPAHLREEQALAEIDTRHGRGEISDACAVTIASWWQSPGAVGRGFARLASTGAVPADDLAGDVAATLTELHGLGLDAASTEARALQALAAWARTHPSRT